MELQKTTWGALFASLITLAACSDSDPQLELILPNDGMNAQNPEMTVTPDPPVTTDTDISSWEFTDECNDDSDMNLKFHEIEDGIRTGFFWPAGTDEVLSFSATDSFNLRCDIGTSICYGAEPQNGSGFYWGVSIDGTQACDNCCSVCGAESRSISLTC